MLDKDQYNQESYNDYYNQATEDAEIKSHRYKKKSNKKLFLSLLFLLLGVIGYVGYMIFNSFNSSSPTTTTTPKSETPQSSLEQKDINQDELINLPKSQQAQESQAQESSTNREQTQAKPKVQNSSISAESNRKEKSSSLGADAVKADDVAKVEPKEVEVKSDEATTDIAKSIEKAIPNSTKMDPTEIAKIVSLVMKEVEKKQEEKQEEPQVQTASAEEDEKVDASSDEALISLLEDSSIDTIQTINESEEDEQNIKELTEKEVSSKKEGQNNYNKVIVSQTPTKKLSEVDELTQLSREISNIIGSDDLSSIVSAPESTSDNYTQSLAPEVDVRSNEMRIIVVQRGDTLGKIALRAYGSAKAYKKIYRANPDLINRPDRIYVGQKLHIPQ